MSTAVRLHRTLPAPPETVYRAWLEPETMRRWFAPAGYGAARAEVDPRVGGRHRIWHVDDDGNDVGGAEGVLIELVPAERIVLMWHFVGPDRSAPPAEETLLTITLRPGSAPGTTDLELEHSRLDGLHAAHPDIVSGIEPGWSTALARLATTLEP